MTLFARGRHKRFRLFGKVSIVVGVVVALKLAAHTLGWEVLSLNPLFSGIIAANVFLMGFLLQIPVLRGCHHLPPGLPEPADSGPG